MEPTFPNFTRKNPFFYKNAYPKFNTPLGPKREQSHSQHDYPQHHRPDDDRPEHDNPP